MRMKAINDVSVVIPYRFSDDWRQGLLDRVLRQWSRILPHSEVVLGRSTPGAFNRSAAINEGASRLSGKLLIVADADVLVSPLALQQSVARVRNRGWEFPFDVYYTMTESWTASWLRDHPPVGFVDEPMPSDVVHRHPGTVAAACESGCLVLQRAAFDRIGGFDEGFVGWGYEDRAFAAAMRAHVGEPSRSRANAFHLWHPVPAGHDPNSDQAMANRLRFLRLQAQGFPIGVR